MSRPRDTYRERVYRAENAAFGESRETMTLAEVRAFVERVRTHPEVYDRFPRARGREITVGDGRGRTRACGNPIERYIKMPRWSRTRWVVLHELAHVFAVDVEEAWHGPCFVATYIHLVSTILGEEARLKLVAELNERNVPWSASCIPAPYEQAA